MNERVKLLLSEHLRSMIEFTKVRLEQRRDAIMLAERKAASRAAGVDTIASEGLRNAVRRAIAFDQAELTQMKGEQEAEIERLSAFCEGLKDL